MSIRLSLAVATVVVAFAGPAFAGCSGESCYRRVDYPPVYSTVSEPFMMRAPRTYNEVVPAEYSTVAETVEVAPAGKVWKVTRDAYGNLVGCWVVVPAQYATRQKTVMVRPAQVIPHTEPAVYGVHQRQVLVAPPRSGWEPIGPAPVAYSTSRCNGLFLFGGLCH